MTHSMMTDMTADARRGFDWQRLFQPMFWLQNYRTDWRWDRILREAIATHGIKRVDEYTAQIGPLTVWTENWPYAYGYLWANYPYDARVLPSVATRKAIRRAVLLPKPSMRVVTDRVLAEAAQASRQEQQKEG